MFGIGPQELVVVFLIALIVVGPKRLPEMARLIGRGLNEFRKVQDEVRDLVRFDLSTDVMDERDDVPDPTAAPEPLPHVEAQGNGHVQDETPVVNPDPFDAPSPKPEDMWPVADDGPMESPASDPPQG